MGRRLAYLESVTNPLLSLLCTLPLESFDNRCIKIIFELVCRPWTAVCHNFCRASQCLLSRSTNDMQLLTFFFYVGRGIHQEFIMWQALGWRPYIHQFVYSCRSLSWGLSEFYYLLNKFYYLNSLKQGLMNFDDLSQITQLINV